MSQTPTPRNRELMLPYVLPLLLYVLPGALLGDSREWAYVARMIGTGGALVWAAKRLLWQPGSGRLGSIALGGIVGLAGTVLWVGLLRPFVPAGGEPWSEAAWALRLVAAGTLPPIFEELLFRGYVLGVATQWDRARRAGVGRPLDSALDERSIAELEPGAWTALAVGLSTLLFALGHSVPEWPAAVAYGLLMCGLWIVRRDLVSCMTAHAVTNVALALYVRSSGHWALW